MSFVHEHNMYQYTDLESMCAKLGSLYYIIIMHTNLHVHYSLWTVEPVYVSYAEGSCTTISR